MDEAEVVEMLASMIAVAGLTRKYYEALLDEGWNEDQAFKLTMGWQHALCGGKGSL